MSENARTAAEKARRQNKAGQAQGVQGFGTVVKKTSDMGLSDGGLEADIYTEVPSSLPKTNPFTNCHTIEDLDAIYGVLTSPENLYADGGRPSFDGNLMFAQRTVEYRTRKDELKRAANVPLFEKEVPNLEPARRDESAMGKTRPPRVTRDATVRPTIPFLVRFPVLGAIQRALKNIFRF